MIFFFFFKGDEEKRLALADPSVKGTAMPNCDRDKYSLHESQLGFLTFMVKPTYDALNLFLCDQPVTKRRSNVGAGGGDVRLSKVALGLSILHER